MAYSDIDKPSDYFNTVLYTGDGTASQPQTGVGFQPDWVWIKIRSTTGGHGLYDVIRGATKRLRSDSTNAENTATDGLTSFDSDGFTVGNNSSTGTSSATYASWNWLAGGTASSNTDGSITSQVSANTTSGFSIVSYSGATDGSTVGHGLNQAPELVIFKNRDYPSGWYVMGYPTNPNFIADGSNLQLSTTAAMANATGNEIEIGSSVITFVDAGSSIGSGNSLSDRLIAYCFHSVKGFSKIGSYTGNGSTNGTFVYTGFKPAFLIQKRTDASNSFWSMWDSVRNTYNGVTNAVNANVSDREYTTADGILGFDFLSNGFKVRDTNSSRNASGGTYIYMAFAENPLVTSTGVPCTAR